MLEKFTPADYWKAIILYGLNSATYKMALARCLLGFANDRKTTISWDELARSFYWQYSQRLSKNAMPQQHNPARLTKLERIVQQTENGQLTKDQAVDQVAIEGFNDVIPRFQTIGTNDQIAAGVFYDYDFGKSLTLTENILQLSECMSSELEDEINARWHLLEGAFSMNQTQDQYRLGNDIRQIYLENGYVRKTLTQNIPFLQGYQGNLCFYCGEELVSDIHVDHVLPRQVLNHDEVWNLVLSHGDCNRWKSDKLVGSHFIKKLTARNENIMGSNHPWKHKIQQLLGKSPILRATALEKQFDQVRTVIGHDYWGGSPGYNPETDPFYRRVVTKLHNPARDSLA